MTRASSWTAGTRAIPRPRSRPLRCTARWFGHALLLACWLLVLLLGALTWGPQATHYRTDVIVGRSMEPAIPLHSVIVVEPVAPAAIRTGDVITYQQPDLPERKVTHRVEGVQRSDEGEVVFVTRGDANEARDPYRVTYAGSGYRVIGHVPHAGWLLIHAQTRWARVLLVMLPVLLLLVMFLRWLWRDESSEPADHDHPTAAWHEHGRRADG